MGLTQLHERSPRAEARTRRGSALVASLVFVTIIAGLGAALVQVHVSTTRQQQAGIDRIRALYVAEAGLAEAFVAVAQGKSGNVGSAAQPARFGDGVYWVEAEQQASGRVRLDAVGLRGSGRIALSQVLARRVNSVAALGLFADGSLTVGEGSVVDGADSRVDESEASDEPPARLGSNGDVTIYGRSGRETLVVGDVAPGPGANLVLDDGVEITGSTAPSSVTVSLPTVDPPVVGSSGSVVLSPGAPLVLQGGRFHYDSIEVRSGSRLIVNGPSALVVGSLRVQPGGELVLDSTLGAVGVYITEYLDLAQDSRLSSPSREATGVALILGELPEVDRDGDSVVDPPVELHAHGEFYGQIYAPHSALSIPSNLRVFGAVSARELTLADGAHITFDHAMTEAGITMQALPRLVSWQVIDLPDEEIVHRRIDPLRSLQLDGVAPLRSSEAHAEHDLSMSYLDTSGIIRQYVGDPQGFDWASLAATVEVDWIDPASGDPLGPGGPTGLPGVPHIAGTRTVEPAQTEPNQAVPQ